MAENIQEFTITIKNREAIGFTENTRNLVIPEYFIGDGKNGTVRGQKYRVTKIGQMAFGNTKLKSVFMPDSITEVENSAFLGCILLEDVRFSQNLERIGRRAFSATNVKSIRLPPRLISIGEEAFYNATKLQTVDTSDASSLQEIESNAFAFCCLKIFILSKSLKTLSIKAFYKCSSLEQVFSKNKDYRSLLNGHMLINQKTQDKFVCWISPKAKYIFIPHDICNITPFCIENCSPNIFIVDKPKNSIFYLTKRSNLDTVYWIG